MSQKFAGLTTTDAIGIEVIMHYIIEFSGPVAPSNNLTLMPGPIVVAADGVITGTGLPFSTGMVWAVNPVLVSDNGQIIGAITSTADKLWAYPSIENAMTSSGMAPGGGTFAKTCRRFCVPVDSRGSYLES
jgi:hypothetical protein